MVKRHAAHIEETRNSYKLVAGEPEGKKSLEDPDECERIQLTHILETLALSKFSNVAQDRAQWWILRCLWYIIGFYKKTQLLDQLNIYQVKKNIAVPWS
jgi:hypothetical protein